MGDRGGLQTPLLRAAHTLPTPAPTPAMRPRYDRLGAESIETAQAGTEGDSRQCRICLSTDDSYDMIAPCSCSGSQKWVHRACVDEWRAQERIPRAFTHCPTCRFEYETEVMDDHRTTRLAKYRLLLCRDSIAVFCAIQAVLALLGYALHRADVNGWIKGLYPHAWAERNEAFHLSVGPYYVSAVVVALALLGALGLVLKATGRLPVAPPQAATVRRHAPAEYGTCDCCSGVYVGGDCNVCCSDCGCAHCGSCECGSWECGACDLGGCGGEGAALLVPIFLAILVLFAVIGVFFGVLFSTIFFQRAAQRHVHLLQMRSETQRVVVLDLAKSAHRC